MNTSTTDPLTLLLAAQFNHGSRDLAARLSWSDLDWESLISHASAEAVLPALAESLTQSNLTGYLPAAVAECFTALADLSRERNQEILVQFREIAAILNEASIEPVVLKGLAYLLTGTYADSGSRYLSDIDLLVHSAQVSSTIEILKTLGYRSDDTDPVAPFRHHAPTLYRAASVPVEIHHSVGLGVCRKLLPTADLLLDSSVMTWNGVRLRIPSPNHLITHLVLHSQLVHPYIERIWPSLRALYDLALLQRHLAPVIDWPSIEKRFRSQHQYATLALHLQQVEESLRLPISVSFPSCWSTRLRWQRRRLLRRFPGLRFVDPIFLFSSLISRRVRVLKGLLFSGGWERIIKRLLQPTFYRRLTLEIERPPSIA